MVLSGVMHALTVFAMPCASRLPQVFLPLRVHAEGLPSMLAAAAAFVCQPGSLLMCALISCSIVPRRWAFLGCGICPCACTAFPIFRAVCPILARLLLRFGRYVMLPRRWCRLPRGVGLRGVRQIGAAPVRACIARAVFTAAVLMPCIACASHASACHSPPAVSRVRRFSSSVAGCPDPYCACVDLRPAMAHQ